jgi:soluble lytic murein transglycosylase
MMSSMGGVRFRHPLLLAAASVAAISAAVAQVPGWQTAQPVAAPPASPQVLGIAGTIATWKRLNQSSSWPFADYAGFLLAHPGWPGETSLRRMAEGSLADGAAQATLAVQYFRRFPPQTAQGHLRYAEALAATRQTADANAEARMAWRAGTLPAVDEAKLLGGFSAAISPADHDARMDKLLWANATSSAQRQLALVSPARRALFAARLAMRTGAPDAAARATEVEAFGLTDAGFLADRARWLRNNNASPDARTLLANRRPLLVPPADVEAWYEVLLTNARAAAADRQYDLAYRIASRVDDAVPAGMAVSDLPYGERDDYTSLVWLAGRTALEDLGRPADAVGMFER